MFSKKKKLYPCKLDWEPNPPGDVIVENMEYYNISREELIKQVGCSSDYLDQVIRGDSPITPELAYKLEPVLIISAETLLNLENLYQTLKINWAKKQQRERRWRFLRWFSPTAISGMIAGCLYRGAP
jgi:plasmid maintenance system antidote protein VapI